MPRREPLHHGGHSGRGPRDGKSRRGSCPASEVRESRREPMKRVAIGLSVGILLVWALPRVSSPVFGQAASAEAPHIGEGGVPQFERDPSWPKVPAKYRMGFGSAVT